MRDVNTGALVRTWRGGIAIGQVAWAPSGRKFTYAARDRREAGKDSSTIWLADLDTGAVTAIVERVENFSGYQWSPDGASVVFAATSKAETDKRGVKLRENLLDRQAGWRDKRFLYQVSVPGGATRRLTAGGLATTASGSRRTAGACSCCARSKTCGPSLFPQGNLGARPHDSLWEEAPRFLLDHRRAVRPRRPARCSSCPGPRSSETSGATFPRG